MLFAWFELNMFMTSYLSPWFEILILLEYILTINATGSKVYQ